MNIAAYLCARYCIRYDRGEEKIFPHSLSYRGAIVPTPPTIFCVWCVCVWLCSSFSQCTIFPFLSLFLCLLIRTEKSLPTTDTEKKKKKRKTFFPNKVSRSRERLSFLSLPLNFCPISSSFSSSASAIFLPCVLYPIFLFFPQR